MWHSDVALPDIASAREGASVVVADVALASTFPVNAITGDVGTGTPKVRQWGEIGSRLESLPLPEIKMQIG